MLEFLTLPSFLKTWRKLKLGQDAFEALMIDLAANPEVGDVIPGSNGLRKLRIKLAGRGKRGGGRVIYAILPASTRILLAAVYSKSEQEDLSQDELYALVQARDALES